MSTLLKNALVYDGIDRDPRRSDILLHKGKIFRIGDVLERPGVKLIDARGHTCIPGLVDVASDMDRFWGPFSDEVQRDYIERGVTTVIGGGGGVSLAPFRADLAETFYAPHFSAQNAGWESVRGFLGVLRRQRLRTHFGTMVGARNIFFAGATERQMQEAVRDALKDGSFGVSFDLGDVSMPPYFSSVLRVAGEELRRSGRMCALRFDPSSGERAGLRRVLHALSYLGEKVYVSHFRPSEMLAADDLVLEFSGYLGVSPSRTSSLPIYQFLPESFHHLGLSVMRERLFALEVEEEILSHLRRLPLHLMAVGYVPHHLRSLQGKSFRALAFQFQLELPRVALHLMRLSRLKCLCVILSAHHRHIRPFCFAPRSLLYPGMGGAHELFSFARLSRSAFGDLVSKMSFHPARAWGLGKRGALRPGYSGDVVLLDRNMEVGRVFVGGELVYDEGRFLEAYPGRVLRS